MSAILQMTEQFVTELLNNKLDTRYHYHNLKHTQRVVKNLSEIVAVEKVNEEEEKMLHLAAWLHDVGYTKGHDNHEQKSAKMAEEFLSKEGLPSAQITTITELILATQRYHNPKNNLENIIRDADSSHFAKKYYPETAALLRKELQELGIADYSPIEWNEANLAMLQNEHQYYTQFAMENWQKGKENNIEKIKKELKLVKKIAKKEVLKARYKGENPDRGVQTLFRVTLKNHLQLSDIADTKANILLSVNAIIISVALSNLIPKLDNPSNQYLIYPTGIFILFSVISMILAVLATRPKITSGTFNKEDVKNRKVNLLFFGNFHKMSLEDYEWAISEMIKDQDYMYSNLTKDLYFLGLVLNRKYKILRWTYSIFIIGIVVSIVAFALAFKHSGIR